MHSSTTVSKTAAALSLVLLTACSGGTERYTADAASLRSTPVGDMVGYRDQADTHAWLGIPYAQSTAGERRWKKPLPARPWRATREAIAFGPPCPQPLNIMSGVDGDRGDIVGSEDCLSLNIWAPAFEPDAIPSGPQALPVMVWIHGGSNTVGSSAMYPAPYLAGNQQVIVVSVNYRLGLLGWFNHTALADTAADLQDASGNYGLLDIIEALRWVRSHIAAFGGDPERVTVFGESAGGRNVYLLLASPMARGLFRGAIAQSGSISTQPLALARNYSDDANPGLAHSSGDTLLRVLQQQGVAADREAAKTMVGAMDNAQITAVLRALSVDELFAGVGESGGYSAPQGFRDGVVLPTTPLPELFLDPGQYNAVPLITGANRDEQKLFLATNPDHSDLWFGLVPAIRDPLNYDRISAYFSDRWRYAAVSTPTTAMTLHNAHPVFNYRFDWDEGSNWWLLDWSQALGAAHGLEIPFVFGDFDRIIPIPGLFTAGNAEGRLALSAAMMDYWGEFAYTGKPGSGRSGDQPKWLPAEADYRRLMRLDTPAPEMMPDSLQLADFREAIASDSALADALERCTLYAQLFYSPTRGRELFSPSEWAALGCGEFTPSILSVAN